MKNTEFKKVVQYTCDSCKSSYHKSFVSFDMIDDLQMRILEMKPQAMNNHYTYGRRKLDFCSTDCALKFLNKEMKMFIKEISASNSKR